MTAAQSPEVEQPAGPDIQTAPNGGQEAAWRPGRSITIPGWDVEPLFRSSY